MSLLKFIEKSKSLDCYSQFEWKWRILNLHWESMIFGGDDKIKAEIVPNSSRQAKNLKMERMSICKQLSLNLFFKMSSKHKDPQEIGMRRLPEMNTYYVQDLSKQLVEIKSNSAS